MTGGQVPGRAGPGDADRVLVWAETARRFSGLEAP